MTNLSTHSRRKFLETAAACTVAGTLLTNASKAFAQNDKLNVAFVGVGGRGGGNLGELYNTGGVNVYSVCDVNEKHLDSQMERHPKAKRYSDFRKLMDELNQVDAVVVSTTEHTHAFATLPALQLRKPVYCEKPLTHNIGEARRIMQEAAVANVATQMGTQIHAGSNYRRVVELIQSRAIGQVREAHVWTSRAWGLQSKADSDANKDIVFVTDRPVEAMKPPENLDWELWIGPAPMRPYHDVDGGTLAVEPCLI
jgi:Oxidoreductase family, NAD-binding Rossmann fold